MFGQDYRCADDMDCEGGWRCKFNDACTDTRAEGLDPGASPGNPNATLYSSLLDAEEATHLATTSKFRIPGMCPDVTRMRDVFAIAHADGRIQRLVVPGYVDAGAQVSCLTDGGSNESMDISVRAVASLERATVSVGTIRALAQSGETTYVLGDGSRLCRITPGPVSRCETLAFAATALRASDKDFLVRLRRPALSDAGPHGRRMESGVVYSGC